MNHSLAIIFNLQLALNRIVKRISENRTNIHNIHRIKQLSVDHTGHINLVLHTTQILTCQERIQHLIPGLIHSLIIMDLIFQLIKIFISLGITPIRPQRNNMILQVMISVVDQIHSALRLFVLFVLTVKNRLDRLQFPLNMRGFPLGLICIKNRKSSEIHKCSHIKYFQAVSSCKRHADRQKTEIAHGKYKH